MDIPAPVFVGFFPKATTAAPDELRKFGVVEIAAVSNCISAAPDDWIQEWKHNAHGFYDSEEVALSVVPHEERAVYDLYAYELIPIEYAERIEPTEVAPAPAEVPADYAFLGYDIVTRSVATFFECSPLSCNLAAERFSTNAHCLITSLPDAYEALRIIGAPEEGYEPGPYYLIAVHRKRQPPTANRQPLL